MREFARIALGCACTLMAAALVYGQARSAPDWTTQGFDAQRSSWVRADPYISPNTLDKFRLIWKLQVDNQSRHGNALTAPVALGNLMTFRGFKSLVFVGGSSNNVYAIDYDFGTLFWRTHHNYTAGAREYAGSPTCPGGMTLGLTRATRLDPVTQLSFFGFARPPRPAKGDVGEPGKGAPQLAEIAARQAAAAKSDARTATPERGAAPARGAAAASAPALPPNYVFSVAADGLLRGLIPDTGDLAHAPVRFLPPNATANSLIWTNGFVYAATSNACGGAPVAVYALDYDAETKPVVTWESGGAAIAGIAVDGEGTVYASTGAGKSAHANSVVALDGKTLQLKDSFSGPEPFVASPVIFDAGGASYVVAASPTNLYLLDRRSLGGPDHRVAISVAPAPANGQWRGHAAATWRDQAGTRWVLAAADDAIAAFRVVAAAGKATLEKAWVSRSLTAPQSPIIVNGVIFALAAGGGGTDAVLYALDPATGKDLWNSGSTMTAPASAGLSAGTGQVHVVTMDNTVWAFGIPLAIN